MAGCLDPAWSFWMLTRSSVFFPPRRFCLLLAALALLVAPANAADLYQDRVLPFLKTYCVQCHSAKKASGELDLTRYPSASAILADFRQWEHVVSFVKKGEMPPAKAKQPTAEERADILRTLEAVLQAEARKLAGDPGAVPPRRLTNAEYDNTIRDITGVDIRPTASFPLDPASGEGFNNTGEALAMSPALLKKYYSAAQHIADHALLTTQGIRFAPHPVVTFADRNKLLEQAIIQFYSDHKVDYEKYLTTLWLHKHRPATETNRSLREAAEKANLSPSYASKLWEALELPLADRAYLRIVREQWNAIPPPVGDSKTPIPGKSAAAIQSLATAIRSMSQRLCVPETAAIVSNAGNGPVDHLERRRRTAASRDEFHFKSLERQRYSCEFPNVTDKATTTLVITVGDYGDAKADGLVVLDGWFSTNTNPSNGSLIEARKKKRTLHAILAQHAPDQLKTLTFGSHPGGKKVDADSLVIQAPATIEIALPSDELGGKNVLFVADARLEGSSQGVVGIRMGQKSNQATNRLSSPLIEAGHPSAAKLRESGEAFCRLFPNRFFYVDDTRGLSAGFHLIEGYFRDDQPLCKLVLNDAEKKHLDSLWTELYFCTDIWHKMLRGFVFFERSERNFLKHVDFDWVKEEDPLLLEDGHLLKFKEVYLARSGVKLTGEALAKHPIDIFFEDIRNGLKHRRETLKRNEPIYLSNLEAFAERACRRPLTDAELQKLRKFYREVCASPEHGVEQAVQASIVRILMSPHFCYRFETAPPGDTVAKISNLDLASRLSYFLWAGPPDETLTALARDGRLQDEKTLREQTRRMLKDPKVGRFALEFFGQWFGYREFLKQESVNREVFKSFDDGLRQAMFEEPTRLATFLLQENEPITELLCSDRTFVNKKLAEHYSLKAPAGSEWEQVNGLHKQGRAGVLGMAVFLTKNSQPQRTSPVKRGFWVVHKLLGEHIPAPPADVATLPAKETDTQGKTIRQLLALHTEDAVCARCHVRFDPVGLAMEGFDPIGRLRSKDLAGRPIDNLVRLPSGKETRGVPEFAQHLLAQRKRDFEKTLCQKLLGYALGRSLQLSDQPLLEKMQATLESNEDRLGAVFETIVTSPQFRNQRCRDFSVASFANQAKGKQDE
jgi:hypothetical protein